MEDIPIDARDGSDGVAHERVDVGSSHEIKRMAVSDAREGGPRAAA